ncbi:MAG TPA: serine protease [Cellvibrio sp.]|nr:serine protease [Cellvibrio sp.]
MRILIKKNIKTFLILTVLSISACSKPENTSAALPSSQIDPAVVSSAEQLGNAYAAIAGSISPAVVSVFSEKTVIFHQQEIPFAFNDELFKEFFGQQSFNYRNRQQAREYRIPQRGMGSGMLIDHQGHILTNFHVISDVDEIRVQFSNEDSFKAKLIGKDEKTDVAIIQLQGTGFEKYPVVTLGDSDNVHVGDVVLAIGAPFGLTQTVTHGIISATGRADIGIADYENFLQTDASINPGNSGGPLVNARAEVIGMNSAIATHIGQFSGVGFSIPSNMIKSMLPKLIKGENILRGELGVSVQNLSEDLAEHFGVKDTKGILVSQVLSNSAADKAGLKVGDIITFFDKKPISDVRTLRNMVAATQPGSKVDIDIFRDQQRRIITAIIQQQGGKKEDVQQQVWDKKQTLNRLGFSVENLSKDSANRFNTKTTKGVVIVDVAIGSPAAVAGIQEGDVIVKSNHQKVESVEEFLKTISDKTMDNFLFFIDRSGSNMFISIRLE